MLAKDAREISQTVKTGIHKSQYERIKDVINKKVKNGDDYCIFYEEFTSVVKKELKSEGYSVIIKNKRDMDMDTYTKISWKRAK